VAGIGRQSQRAEEYARRGEKATAAAARKHAVADGHPFGLCAHPDDRVWSRAGASGTSAEAPPVTRRQQQIKGTMSRKR
jgi:hypothetical protein